MSFAGFVHGAKSVLTAVGKAMIGIISSLSISELVALGILAGSAVVTAILAWKRYRKMRKYNKQKGGHGNPVVDTLGMDETPEDQKIVDEMLANSEEEAGINASGASKDFTKKKVKKTVRKATKKMDENAISIDSVKGVDEQVNRLSKSHSKHADWYMHASMCDKDWIQNMKAMLADMHAIGEL